MNMVSAPLVLLLVGLLAGCGGGVSGDQVSAPAACAASSEPREPGETQEPPVMYDPEPVSPCASH